MLEIVWKAHKTDNFWKFSHSNFFSNFSEILCYVRFSVIFYHFLIFRKFLKFYQITTMRCMPASVNATDCLCRTRSLSHAVADSLGVFVMWPRCVWAPVSICDLRGVCCTLAFNRLHVRDRVRQRPRSSDTVHKQFDRHPLLQGIRWGEFWYKFWKIRKIEKCWKLSEKRTKPKISENVHIKFFFEFFKNFMLCALFSHFLAFFDFSQIFEIFKILSNHYPWDACQPRWMPPPVSAGLGLYLTR
jgi:hypothetical protein